VRSPSAKWRSVRHTPQADTRTLISPGPGSGTGRSTAVNGAVAIGPGVPTTHAFISLSLLERDDHDRAGRVVRDLVADRSEQEAAEATDAT
jgi:hypothetical protein